MTGEAGPTRIPEPDASPPREDAGPYPRWLPAAAVPMLNSQMAPEDAEEYRSRARAACKTAEEKVALEEFLALPQDAQYAFYIAQNEKLQLPPSITEAHARRIRVSELKEKIRQAKSVGAPRSEIDGLKSELTSSVKSLRRRARRLRRRQAALRQEGVIVRTRPLISSATRRQPRLAAARRNILGAAPTRRAAPRRLTVRRHRRVARTLQKTGTDDAGPEPPAGPCRLGADPLHNLPRAATALPVCAAGWAAP